MDDELKFVEGLYDDAEEEIKDIYRQQKKARDELLNQIALVMLAYTVIDDVMRLSRGDKIKEYSRLSKLIKSSCKATGKAQDCLLYTSPIVVWGKIAESTANYMSKGKLIGIAGRIETRSYGSKDGGRRYITEVVADEVSFLEWGGNKTSGSDNGNIPSDYFGQGDMEPIDDPDMPF